jgi:hypothetical protein
MPKLTTKPEQQRPLSTFSIVPFPENVEKTIETDGRKRK